LLPIADYPEIVTKYLRHFEGILSKPQLEHLAEYLTGLFVCDNHAVQGINNSFIEHKDQSALNRFLTESEWSEEKLNDIRLKLALSELGDAKVKHGCLLIDDTLTHKTGKFFDGIGKFYDHVNENYTLGHQLVTSHFVGSRMHFPVGWKLYKQCKTETPKDDPEFRSKPELARELIEEAHRLGIPFSVVLGDSWYFNKEMTELIEALGYNWIFGCKSNRIVFVNNVGVSLAEWIKTIPREKFQKINVGEKEVWCYLKSLRMSNQGKVLVVALYDNEELKGEPKFLATNCFTWESKKIVSTYAKRWTVDVFYRDSKQNLGLEEYELRSMKGIRRHWCLVFLAYTLLQLNSSDGSLVRWLKTNLETVGERCRLAMAEVLKGFVIWVLKQRESGRNLDEMMWKAFASRQEVKALI